MTKTHDKEFEIALSFAGEDRDYVDQVANLLRESGVAVFYDLFEEANLWGKNLYDYLSEIYMSKAVYTIMFISEHYATKLWANLERQAMQAKAFQENQEYILPARFDDTDIPGVLPTTGYIDLRGKTPEELVEIIHRKLINNGLTVPSQSIRRQLFSVSSMVRAEHLLPEITITSSNGSPVSGADVVAIADNGTTRTAQSNAEGVVPLSITTRRQFEVLVAHPGFPAAIIHDWDPGHNLSITLEESESLGSVICRSTGHIPGLSGRLNPILDTSNRTYLYADNIAINGGENEPATFVLNEPFELEDSNGTIMIVRVLFIRGRVSLLQFAHPKYN